jgi:hypothetical protein
MQFKVNFTDDISLYYNLVDHDMVRHWSTLIAEQNITNCCKINHYSGYHDPDLVQQRISRLYDLLDIINTVVSEKIQKIIFSKDTFTDALNTMHVHFPEFKTRNEYSSIKLELDEYNDIIHWLEAILPDFYNKKTDSRQFSIKLDFNKSKPYQKHPIPESAYSLFNGYLSFGQLMLHYVHVGRHAWELMFANDLVCPKEQFVPQSEYKASVRLHFYDSTLDHKLFRESLDKKWNSFYLARGGKEFFEYDINDPKIGFGYCQIGTLEKVTIGSSEMTSPFTIKDIFYIRPKITKTRVLDWEIINGA